MAVICKDINLLYICIPKTGSTSVSNALIEQLNGSWIPEEKIFDKNGSILVDNKHSTIRELISHGILSKDELDQLHIITSVRNPYEQVVSNYFFFKQIYQTYKRGIQIRTLLGVRVYLLLRRFFNLDRSNHYSWIMQHAGRMHFIMNHSFEDYVFKYYSPGKNRNLFKKYIDGADVNIMKLENIEEDLPRELKKVGVTKSVELPHLSKSSLKKKKDYRKYYTPAATELVGETFRDELGEFGYSF